MNIYAHISGVLLHAVVKRQLVSFLVGSRGSVVSVEIREDHLKRAVRNYRHWRTSWNLRRGEEWPDNVQFHNADLCRASLFLAGQGFHAVSVCVKKWFSNRNL